MVEKSEGKRKVFVLSVFAAILALGYIVSYFQPRLLPRWPPRPQSTDKPLDYTTLSSLQRYICSDSGGIAKFKSRTFSALHSILADELPRPEGFIQSFRSQCWYRNTSTTNGNLTCVPKVFLAGFPKCGSTQLYQMILKSEEVVGGAIKELHWWTRNVRNGTIELYLNYFSQATNFIRLRPRALALDGSQSTIWETGYTQNTCDIPRLMSTFLPDAKYILIMREPVSRLYSDFLYFCQNRGNFSSAKYDFHQYTLAEIARFNECITHLPLSICVRNSTHDFIVKETSRGVRLGIGIYYDHISRWLQYVPRQQFLFLRTEDMATDPFSTVQQVWKFLSVEHKPKEDLNSLLYSQKNKNPHDDMLPKTRKILTSFYGIYNQMLAVFLNDTKYRWDDN